MNKSESKYFNTARIMDEALLELLEKKDFEYITVKELCNKAGVNRSTFYLHYESMNDLLKETIEMISQLFEQAFPISFDEMASKIENMPLSDLIFINKEYLLPYLNFIKTNKKIFKAAQRNPQCMEIGPRVLVVCKHILVPIYKRFNIPEKEHKYWISFYNQGLHSIINRWVQNECEETVEELIEIIVHCVRPYLPENKKD